MNAISIKDPLSKDTREKLAEYSDIVSLLLFEKGIENTEQAEEFLNPDYDRDVHDPFLMKGMQKAVDRIIKAIENKEKIAIFSDYDCDGVPGGALMHDFLQKAGANFINYIPQRTEGYGLSEYAVEKFHDEGVALIITVDCGIADVPATAKAKELGIEVIITDHHLPQETLPDALAILNPKQADCGYPYKELCGTGVAFKLVQALATREELSIPVGFEKWLLDLVAIATVADMVPMTGENRVFVYYGLIVLRKMRRPGVFAMSRAANLYQKNINEDDIAFTIAPRINAAGRQEKQRLAFELLITEDSERAQELAKEMESLKRKQKTTAANITKSIKKKVKDSNLLEKDIVVLGDPAWAAAVLGLVANGLVQEFGKTFVLWGTAPGGELKGSARSRGEVNLVELFTAMDDQLERFGGHAPAAGFSISREQAIFMEEHVHNAYEKVPKHEVEKDINADALLSVNDVSVKLFDELNRLSPFGFDAQKPVFLFKNETEYEFSWFGKGDAHAKVVFENGLEMISFFAKGAIDEKVFADNKPISFTASIEHDSMKRRPRLRLLDVLE